MPEDLVLTPTVALFWFLGDGSTAWTKTPSKTTLVDLRLHTNSFTDTDVKRLIQQLTTANSELQFRLDRSAQGHPVVVSKRSDTIRAFFDYIGPLPEELAGCEEMESKWKLPTAQKLPLYGDRLQDEEVFRIIQTLSNQGYGERSIARELTNLGFNSKRKGQMEW